MKTSVRIFCTFSFLILACISLQGQTLLVTEDFETDDEGVNYRSNTFNDGGNDVWERWNVATNPSGVNNNFTAPFSGQLGSYAFGGEDLLTSDNPLGSSAACYLTLKTIDISSYVNGTCTVKVYLAAGLNAFENTDYLKINYAFDSDISDGANSVDSVPKLDSLITGNYTTTGAFYGILGSNLFEDTDLDGAANAGADSLTYTFTQYEFVFSIPSGSNNLSIQIEALLSAGSEEGAIDHIEVFGNATTSPLMGSIAINNHVSCNGFSDGSLTASASQGVGPYTYLWSNGGTSATNSGLAAGTYTVTITDNAASTLTFSETITQPTALTINAVVDSNETSSGASDGGITATASGGTGAYNFNWSGGTTTNLFSQSFESDPTDTWNYTAFPATYNTEGDSIIDGSDDVWAVLQEFTFDIDTASDGLLFWGGQDLNNPNGGGFFYHTLAFDPVDVSALNNVYVSFQYFTDGYDTSDSLQYQVKFDNGTNWDTTGIELIKNSQAWETVVVAVPDSASFVRLRFQARQDGSSDFVGFDNIQLNTSSSSVNGLAAGSYTVTVSDDAGCSATATATVSSSSAPLAVSVSGTNVNCFGGSNGKAVATTTGGSPNYTYNWSNGSTTANTASLTDSITSLFSGTYTVTVTDNVGSTATASVFISSPTAVNGTITSTTDVSCNGASDGSATASASNGTGPYTYLWSNAATSASNTGLAAGTYTMTVTDTNGCTDVETVTINEPTALIASATATQNVTTNGGSDGIATASSAGGTPPYTYSWNNAQITATNSALTAGTYSLTVTDANGCTDSASVTITQPGAGLSGPVYSLPYTENFDAIAFDNVSFGPGSEPFPVSTNGLFVNDWQNVQADAASQDWYGRSTSTGSSNTGPTSDHTGGGRYIFVEDGFGNHTDITLESPLIDLVGVTSAQFTYWAHSRTTSSSHNKMWVDINDNGVWVNIDSIGQLSTTDLWVERNIDVSAWVGDTVKFRFRVDNSTTSFQHDIAIDDVSIIETVFGASLDSTVTSITCFGDADGFLRASAVFGTTPYTYNWSSGDTNAAIGNLTAGVYTVTVSDNAGSTAVLQDTISNLNPALNTTFTVNSPSCNGGNDGSISVATISGGVPTVANLCSAVSLSCSGATTLDTLGTDSMTLSNTSYPAPYGNWYWGAKHQILFRASELNAMGLIDTTVLTSLAFDVASMDGGATANYSNFTISMACTNDTSATSWISGLSTVLAPSSQTISLGVNTHVFDTPYIWDGVSNLVVEVCFNNSGFTRNSVTYYSTTPFTSVRYYRADISTVCSNTSSTTGTSANRPNIIFGSCAPSIQPYNYSWSTGGTNDNINGLSAGTYTLTVTDDIGCMYVDTIMVLDPAPTTPTISSTDISCNGLTDGSMTASISGGTPPYAYLWSTGDTVASISNLAVGTYTVSITDNAGCLSTGSASISEPAVLAASMVVDSNVTCNGFSDGGATASVSGGTSPYTYNWSNTATSANITGVAAGTYSVTVTDNNGCTATGNTTITEPTALSTSTAVDSNVTCNGFSDGGATASASGGTMPYTYSWSNSASTASITGIVAGSYTVTTTDNNGCTATSTVTITEPMALLATVVVDSNVSCNGFTDGGASASATGGTGAYNYSWSNGSTTASITGLVAGTYTVTVTDMNGCTDTDDVTVTEPSSLSATITSSTNVSCNGGNDGATMASASGGTSPYTYSWSNTGTTANNTSLIAGSYTVTVVDNNGCTATANTTISEPTALTNTSIIVDVSCNGGSDGSINTTVSGGTPAYTYSWSNGSNTADLTGLTAGTYIATITDANGCTIVETAIINEPTAAVLSLNLDSAVSCNGFADGGISATVSGGTAPYAYSWSTGDTTTSIGGLTAGTYTLTVTDAHACITIDSMTVNQPMALSLSFNVDTAITCFGGSNGAISATVNGGTAPYGYQWNSGDSTASRSGLSTGTYVLAITDANACMLSDSTLLTEPAELITNLSDTACDSYTWAQNGMSYNASGVYDDTVMASNGCDSIIRLDLLILNSTSSSSAVTACFSYTWPQNGMTYTQTGVYVDTMSGANAVGCDSIISLNLTIDTADVSVIRNGLDLIALATGGSATYQWLDCGNGDTAITGATSNIFTIPRNGFYSVVVTQNGCMDTSICINVINIGLEDNQLTKDNLKIYPNPTREEFTFSITGIENHELGIVQIFDLSGNIVREIQLQTKQEVINVSDFADGIYLVKYGNTYQKLIVTK